MLISQNKTDIIINKGKVMRKFVTPYVIVSFFNTCGCITRKMYTADSVILQTSQLFYSMAHIRFSSIFSATTLSLITGYSVSKNATALVYILSVNSCRLVLYTLTTTKVSPNSIRSLYYNAWWYERETTEMLGADFTGSIDNRCLLLPYGFSENPIKKDIANNYAYVIRYDSVDQVLRWSAL